MAEIHTEASHIHIGCDEVGKRLQKWNGDGCESTSGSDGDNYDDENDYVDGGDEVGKRLQQCIGGCESTNGSDDDDHDDDHDDVDGGGDVMSCTWR